MMRALKKFTLLFFLSLACLRGITQSASLVEVSGKVHWKAAGITAYPTELKVVSSNNHVLLTPIDSTGSFHLQLTPGPYMLSPSRHYHWMGEDYIRINETVSQISIDVPAQRTFIAPILELDTLVLTNVLPPHRPGA